MLTSCATNTDPNVYLKIETISSQYLVKCELKFAGYTTEDIVKAYQEKAACDNADKAAARKELERLNDSEES